MEVHISVACCILWLELSVFCLKEDNKTETECPQCFLEPSGLGENEGSSLYLPFLLLAAAFPKEVQLWQALKSRTVFVSLMKVLTVKDFLKVNKD